MRLSKDGNYKVIVSIAGDKNIKIKPICEENASEIAVNKMLLNSNFFSLKYRVP